MLVFVLRESVFHLLPGWTIRFRASVVTSRERGRFDVLLTVFPPLESVFDVVFDHTLLLFLVLMIATLLLFLLFLSLSRLKPKKSSAREEDDRMGDAVFVGKRDEREKTTNTLEGRRERRGEKSVAKIWKSGKRTDAPSFCIFFLLELSCFLSLFCPFFLFEGTSFLLFCGITLRDIKKHTDALLQY